VEDVKDGFGDLLVFRPSDLVYLLLHELGDIFLDVGVCLLKEVFDSLEEQASLLGFLLKDCRSVEVA